MSVKQNLLDSDLIIAGRIKEDSPMKHSKLIKRSNGNLKKRRERFNVNDLHFKA